MAPKGYIIVLFMAVVGLVSSSDIVKVTTTIMLENDSATPIVHHLMDCDENNGHSRLSHIIAKLDNLDMPITHSQEGKLWRIDLSSNPIEPGVTKPLVVTKVYSHLELKPAHDIYLMPFSTIKYQVRVVKQGRPQKIKIPSEQYYLTVDDGSVVDLDESTSTALALEAGGSTTVKFIDKSLMSDQDFIQPESTIHIVNPSYLTIHINPGGSWALQKFTDYIVEIRIFDEQQHQIYPSDNLQILLASTNEIVITNSTVNGTYHTIHTLSAGPSRLTAKLLGTTPTLYSYGRPSQEIELVQDLGIYEPLEIKPTAIILPWLPDTKPSYEVSIFAAGGTGSYLWSANNSVLTDITYGEDSSVAKITTSGEGTAFIECKDKKSSVFTRHALVAVSRIVEIAVLPSITETELGEDILLPVAVYANATLPEEDQQSGLVLFHDCSKIKFDVEIVEKARFTYDADYLLPNTRTKSCASLKFTCSQPGSSRVWISYTDPTEASAKPIKTTSIIACYKPLRPVYPAEIGVLAPHTSIDLAFEGGPRPFGIRVDDHYAYLEPDNSPIVTFTPIIDRYRSNKDLHVFRAHCNDYGELTVSLNVGNQPSNNLPNPASSKAALKIICAKPDSVQLRPRFKETCPFNQMASLVDTVVPVSANFPTEFELSVYDDSKRMFLNISSLKTNWTLQGHAKIAGVQLEEVNAVYGYRRITRNYIIVEPNGLEGLGSLQVDVLDLTSNLDIKFVHQAHITPNQTIIFNHKKNVIVATLLKGSGYFSIESIDGAQHANVTLGSVLGHHRLEIQPLNNGKLSVNLDDSCLPAPIVYASNIVSLDDFDREVLRSGRSVIYYADADMFSMYIVETNLPKRTKDVAPPTVVPKTSSVKPQVLSSPPPTQVVELSTERYKSNTTTTVTPKVASIKGDSPMFHTLFRVVMGYLMSLLVTLIAIALGWVWWQKYRIAKMGDRRVAFNR